MIKFLVWLVVTALMTIMFYPLGFVAGLILGAFLLLGSMSGAVAHVVTHTKCPSCKEEIKSKATMCKHCGTDIGAIKQDTADIKAVNDDEDYQRRVKEQEQFRADQDVIRAEHTARQDEIRAGWTTAGK